MPKVVTEFHQRNTPTYQDSRQRETLKLNRQQRSIPFKIIGYSESSVCKQVNKLLKVKKGTQFNKYLLKMKYVYKN